VVTSLPGERPTTNRAERLIEPATTAMATTRAGQAINGIGRCQASGTGRDGSPRRISGHPFASAQYPDPWGNAC
jgi:hypothetical protein